MVSIWKRPYIACKSFFFQMAKSVSACGMRSVDTCKICIFEELSCSSHFSNDDVKILWNIQFGGRLALKYTTTYATYRDLNYSAMFKTRGHYARNWCDLFERVCEGMLLFCIIFDAYIISLTRFDICWKCALDSHREDFILHDVIILG